ncbi:serpin family protein [Mucilaginibacter sp. X4EP1]|uniref:serpin family protein n=1 Tax=Mucilaginibacter sp. X4EP1 TaxID=2723092 RepID=UPI002169BA15|nr:serpin family protein [Mucilaginibacter sp. X4EP1]MCS3815241.1 serpin B [Mucilaginibacter sp. X4EP1]
MVNRKTPLLALCLLFIGFASCKKSTVTPHSGPGKDLVLSAFEQQKVTSDNAFTLSLFKNLDSANTSAVNLFASPLSVSFALGMTSNGANGATLDAFKKVLNFNTLTTAQINTYYQSLLTNLPELDPNTTVKIANSIWYRQGFSVVPQFLQTNSTYFNAKVQALNFNDASSVTTINNWVSNETNGAIPSIVNSISSTDMMYLVNAIYFKSVWNEKFDPAKTTPLPFTLANNSQVTTSFMDGKVDFKRFDNSEVHVFELPYSNNRYSMVIAMPADGTTVQQLAAGLDSAKWNLWTNSLHATNAELKLPKFKFSYSVNLNSPLTELGLGIAFTPTADFSGISTGLPLQISNVYHKAYVEVDESGTTAAAATVVVVGTTAAPIPQPTIIDHPFIFAIRQVNTGLILFTGVMNNPLQSGS